MIECTVDTHVLADILMQYSAIKPNTKFKETEFLTHNILSKVNLCVESDGFEGVVVASTFAFVEIVNQFEKVSKDKFDLPKMIGFINQPPDWFVIEPFANETVKKLIIVPKYNLKQESIGLEDAIHVATAIQRGPNTYLATHDGILAAINYDNISIIHLL